MPFHGPLLRISSALNNELSERDGPDHAGRLTTAGDEGRGLRFRLSHGP